jgi:hypothetical protein
LAILHQQICTLVHQFVYGVLDATQVMWQLSFPMASLDEAHAQSGTQPAPLEVLLRKVWAP